MFNTWCRGDTQNSFTKRTGAEKYIKGRFFLDGNQLLFQCQIINASNGEVEMTLPTIKGPRDNQTELVSEMQQKFTTAFAAKGHSWSPGIAQNPPTYEAYELYREGADIYSTDFEKASPCKTRPSKPTALSFGRTYL